MGWSASRLQAITEDLDGSVLAVQETHLLPVKLERAHCAARRAGCRMVHGRAVLAKVGRATDGQHLGVGFVVREAVVTQPVLPTGAAGRMLHATRRLCMLRLPPSLAMPQGLMLASFYAPQAKSEDAPRFRAAVIEVLTAGCGLANVVVGGLEWDDHSIARLSLRLWSELSAAGMDPGSGDTMA